MSRRKQRTKEQKEIALHDLLVLMRRGVSKREAGRLLGVDEKQVRRDWEEITHWLKKDNEKNLGAMLEQYREVKAQAWAAWDQSKEPKERTLIEKVTQTEGGQAEVKRVRVVKVSESRLPEAAYLETVRRVLDRECELRALNPPKNMNLTVEELEQEIEAELAWLADTRQPPISPGYAA